MSERRTVHQCYSTWNPMTNIEDYCIVNDKRIQDYENIFMAAYVIGLESQLERITSSSTSTSPPNNFDTQMTNRNKDEETLVQQFRSQFHEQSTNDADHLLLVQSILEKIIIFNNAQKSYPRGIRRVGKKSIGEDQHKESLSLEALTDLQSTNNKKATLPVIKEKSLKSTKQLADSFSKLTLDDYNQKCIMLDGMMKSLKDTFTEQRNTYQKYKDKLDNEIMKKMKNFPKEQFKEFSSVGNSIPADSKKQFPNTLREILGYKRYFEMIESSNLLSLYNQMYVSRRLAKTTLKKYTQLQKEKIKLQLNAKHAVFNGIRKYRHNLWKYNIPEIMKSIHLDENDLEYAFKKLNKHLEIDYTNFKVEKILEAFSNWYTDINLFIVLASLAERIDGLESLVRNNIHKVGAQSLPWKIKKARELFALIDCSNKRQHSQKLYANQTKTHQNSFHSNITTHMPKSSKEIQYKKIISEGKFTSYPEYIQGEDMKLFFYASNIHQGHVEKLIQHLDHHSTGKIDFVTFLEYLPLFVECHKQILCKPLSTSEIFIP